MAPSLLRRDPCSAPLEERHAAYDQGFSDGGGDRTDLFDAARRSLIADMRRDNLPKDLRSSSPDARCRAVIPSPQTTTDLPGGRADC